MAALEHRIRDRAYAIWEQEGRPEGREAQHWERAAREVLSSGEGIMKAKAGRSAKPAGTSKSAARGRSRKAA